MAAAPRVHAVPPSAPRGVGRRFAVAGALATAAVSGTASAVAATHPAMLIYLDAADIVQARFGASIPKVFPGLKRQSTGCMIGV